MENENIVSYKELKIQHDKTAIGMKKVLEAIQNLEQSGGEFYNDMRWSKNSCTEKQYESLFNLVYIIEEYNLMGKVCDLEELLKKGIE